MCVQESRRAGEYLGRRGQEKKQDEVLCSHNTNTNGASDGGAAKGKHTTMGWGMRGGGINIPSRGQLPTADAKRIHISTLRVLIRAEDLWRSK